MHFVAHISTFYYRSPVLPTILSVFIYVMHVRVCVCMQVCVCVCVSVCLYVCVHACVHVYVNASLRKTGRLSTEIVPNIYSTALLQATMYSTNYNHSKLE